MGSFGGGGQHSTTVSTLASGPSCPGFASRRSRIFSEEKFDVAGIQWQQVHCLDSGQCQRLCSHLNPSSIGESSTAKKNTFFSYNYCYAEISTNQRSQKSHVTYAIDRHGVALTLPTKPPWVQFSSFPNICCLTLSCQHSFAAQLGIRGYYRI